jgi:hypothetical protein
VRAMVLVRPGTLLVMRERPKPSPGPGEILIEIEACGVCRTDLHVVDGELPDPKLPIVPGHEIVGRVLHRGRPRRQGAFIRPIFRAFPTASRERSGNRATAGRNRSLSRHDVGWRNALSLVAPYVRTVDDSVCSSVTSSTVPPPLTRSVGTFARKPLWWPRAISVVESPRRHQACKDSLQSNDSDLHVHIPCGPFHG